MTTGAGDIVGLATETRMPSSSISISPTPLSWTIFTSSRIRSARVTSTSPVIRDVSA